VVSIAGVAAGFGLLSWALNANRYFVKEVRIQEERGHELVTSGPYQYIRHPGYAGFTIIFLISGLALGSWLSFLVGVGIGLYFVWRTGIEDLFLHENLEGYTDYVEKVQYRLIPGLW
jgi:protein-S-isoprenylcysteine O-methyltransferase Ste14